VSRRIQARPLPVAIALLIASHLHAPSVDAQAARSPDPAGTTPSVDPVRVQLDRLPRPPPRQPRRPVEPDEDEGWRDVNDGLSLVFFRFFGNGTPNPSGVERPGPDERMLAAVAVPLGGSPLSFVAMGAGNNRLLTSSYFYQQYDGLVGLRYGFVPLEARSPFQVSLTVSPLSGSFTRVRIHLGTEEVPGDPEMPSTIHLGGAAGLDATYTHHVVRLEARAYALPQMDMGYARSTGVAQLQSLQVTFRLTEAFRWNPHTPFDLHLVAMHVDRGEQRAAMYDWSAQGFRPVRDLREVWQAMVVLSLRRD
jgi:hypothetical protein